MRIAVFVAALLLLSLHGIAANEVDQQSRQLAREGKSGMALERLQAAVRENPDDLDSARALAEFLDRFGSPARAAAYDQYWRLLETRGSADEKRKVLRRLSVLSLEEDNRQSLERYMQLYRQTGAADLAWPVTATGATKPTYGEIEIPGPLAAFARMTAITPDLDPEQLMSALARNVVISGFRSSGPEGGMIETEYLRLVFRYLEHARDLTKLAGSSKVLEIAQCETRETGELLKILGYRMRGGCGGEVVLETVNPTKAFVTVDSGFPLAELEEALRTNRPFRYDMTPTRVPVLFGPDYWQLKDESKADKSPIELFLSDPARCRMYLSIAKLESGAAELLRKEVEYEKLRAFAHVIDFYGGMFHVVDGKVVTPGGARSVSKWESMVGGSVNKPADFFLKLMARDDGWLASYYDALSRIEGPVKSYLTEPARMERFYDALRGRITSPGPARPVFRANTDMLIFTHRLRLDGDGKPHVPGGLALWKSMVADKKFVEDKRLRRAAPGWQEADDLIAALFGLSRSYIDNVPLKIFVALSEMNRLRDKPLEPATVSSLIDYYPQLQAQYSLLSELPTLTDDAIQLFLTTAPQLSKGRNEQLRGDAVGSLQGLLGLWQVYVRHGLLEGQAANDLFLEILNAYQNVGTHQQLFDQTRKCVESLIAATGGAKTDDPQAHLMALLAGTREAGDSQVRDRQIRAMEEVMSAQRLMTLGEIFTLADQLVGAASGAAIDTNLVNRLTAKIGRIQSARSSMSTEEKNALSFGRFTEDHIERERKVRLRAEVDKNANSPEKLLELREVLMPHLRDTLVGLNYAHYAPPGGQILLTNGQFVRYHDFAGLQSNDYSWAPTELVGVGWSATSGGRLMGSLSELPYALAQAEQNFLIPEKEQALIWGDLVPQMLLTATVPRWWKVTPVQRHYVALLQRAGRSLLAESMLNSGLRASFLGSLERWSSPHRVAETRLALDAGNVRDAEQKMMPAELFRVAYDLLAERADLSSPLYDEIRQLQRTESAVDMAVISDLFGTPKPALTRSYRRELLGLRTMPTLMGYSSRLMAETWESSALYWAEVSDRLHMRPEELNLVVPEWTRETVEGIFATHLEDWPALLRSMRKVGESKTTAPSAQPMVANGQ
ncbi:MAG: hypothetical protein MUF01_01730 [Bryobacterales bacterium]|nr:hypothetical protein [Bryobacterales bacterium]